jgi:hypothetical protein
MADTSKTLAQILALFANNTSGDISPQDLRDFVVSVMGGYGAIYTDSGSTAQTSISGTPAKVTGFAANGLSNNATPDHTDDSVQVGIEGIYLAFFQGSFTGTSGKTFKCEIYNAGVASGYHCQDQLSTTVEESMSCMGILSLAADAKVTVYISSPDSGTSFTPSGMQLVVVRLA